MSLAAQFLRQAAEISAMESTRRLDIEDWKAGNLAPIALSLLMRGLLRRTNSPVGALRFSAHLNQYPEDLLASQRRLSAPDVRARGRALSERILGPYCNRAIQALADLATIDPHRASELLSMTAAAAVSALSRTQRELELKTFELRGVLKSEAAQVDSTDPKLARQVSTWVFRPSWLSRGWNKARCVLLGWSPRPTSERPGLRLRRPAPVRSTAPAARSEPNVPSADTRPRLVSAERRAEAKADVILARTLRSDNSTTRRPRPNLNGVHGENTDKVMRMRAGAR